MEFEITAMIAYLATAQEKRIHNEVRENVIAGKNRSVFPRSFLLDDSGGKEMETEKKIWTQHHPAEHTLYILYTSMQSAYKSSHYSAGEKWNTFLLQAPINDGVQKIVLSLSDSRPIFEREVLIRNNKSWLASFPDLDDNAHENIFTQHAQE